MEKYVWLFPIIFIFHDMEEIIGLKKWLDKNRILLDKKYPFISAMYKDFSTEGFAVAVFEELIACIIICALAIAVNNQYVWLLWLGGFIGCTLHFFIHIVQAVIIRKYIPAVITSIISLPISIWLIRESLQQLNASISVVILWSIIGIAIVGVNLKFAQSLIGKFTRWQNR